MQSFRLWIQRLMLGAAVLVAVLEAVIIFNLAHVKETQLLARRNDQVAVDVQESLYRLKREARSRAALYDALIQQKMLVRGMVVHRDSSGRAHSVCDSLLFSSLRYSALRHLGMERSATEAWQAIEKSRDHGLWWRHPQCRQKSLSRDMIMGVMVALKADPPNGQQILRELLAEIDRRQGSVGNGPFFVSYLSPGPAGLLRQLAISYNIPYAEWPWVLKQSFSSVEYDTLFLKPGYESHLAGLSVWLEMEMQKSQTGFNPRSLLGQAERLWTGAPAEQETQLDQQRSLWVASQLSQDNPENLFFSYLLASVAKGIDDQVRVRLLSELLSMPQFPVDRLPQDCDRDADYLWQRRQAEYLPVAQTCDRTWAGVDFLWMAGLLAGK